jgi:hypothetical protein
MKTGSAGCTVGAAGLGVLVGACLLAGCGGDQPPTATGDETGIGDGSGTASGGINLDDGEVLDVANGGSAGNDSDSMTDGCKKVDLLFVIDNSVSMANEQGNLVSSFPGFIEAMREQLADTQGYHVGITTTDIYTPSLECAEPGSLVVRTGGDDSSDEECGPYAEGGRYMTEADDLENVFSCAAQVGVGGDIDERPITMMLSALSDDQNGAGGCNEGFLRDDALLVVVLITDEEDDVEEGHCESGFPPAQDGSGGEPPGWFEGLAAVKDGNEKSIVVLSLVGPSSGRMCPELDFCSGATDGAEVANRLIEFTEMFTYGFVGSVCEPYGPFFEEAISGIASACNEFMPTE